MTDSTPFKRAVIGGLAAVTLVAMAWAGELEPPGPPAPTMKPLTDLEPRTAVQSLPDAEGEAIYRITEPGSYYLTGNIVAPSSELDGIHIEANHVTLDLNGFEIVGPSDDSLNDGITLNTLNQTNVTLRNGTVRNWGGDGIKGFNSFDVSVEYLRIFDNGKYGISIGNRSQVTHCHVSSNQDSGIVVGRFSNVSHCSVTSNGSHGILAGDSSSMSHIVASFNSGTGIHVGSNCTVTDSHAQQNQVGFSLDDGSTLVASTSWKNFDDGVSGTDGVVILGSRILENHAVGISVRSGIIADSVIRLNFGGGIEYGSIIATSVSIRNSLVELNAGFGIRWASAATANIEGCTLMSNGDTGIRIARGSVRNCTISGHNQNGIFAFGRVLIRGNQVDGRSIGTGIRVQCPSDEGSRIEGNFVTNHEVGIDVNCAARAVLIDNTTSGNGVGRNVVAGNLERDNTDIN